MKTNNGNKLAPIQMQSTIAIVQLTRFGDLLQTYQALSELKASSDNYRVILIARTQFAQPLRFLLDQVFDQIYTIDTKNIFDQKETAGLSKTLNSLNGFLTNINNESIDVLINLSFSKSSAYLSSLIRSKHKIGSYFDFTNKMQINDKWSQYLFATVMRGSHNPYSLVDLFKSIIGIKSQDKAVTKDKIQIRKNNIIVHPFASHDRKAWKSEKWVEIIYKTLKENEHSTVEIVGAKNEILKSQMISENPLLKSFGPRIINSTGKTTIQELFTELTFAKLFVGHDSMVGHLAAIANTTTLTISLGSVRPHETTPYQTGAYNISPRTKCFPCFPSDACSYTQCHHDIPYQIVSASIKQLMTTGSIDPLWVKNTISGFHSSSVNFYKSKITKGQMSLESLIDGQQDSMDVFRSLYKITWSFVIAENEQNIPFPKLNPSTHRLLLDAMTGLQHLFELAEFGAKYSKYILEEISSQTPSIVKIKEYSKKIDEIDQLQNMVQRTSPNLAPIIDYFTVRKANLFGDNVVKLTESSYYSFIECSQLCSIMFELIENTVAEYKLSSGKMPRPDANK